MFCENVVLNDTGWLFGEKTVWTGEEQLVSNIQWMVVRCDTLLHDFVNGLVNTLLNDKEVLKYIMGEVMICRGGRGGGNSHAGLENVLTTLIFNANDTWTVPEGVVNNEVSVRIFGGGANGTGYNSANPSASSIVGVGGGSGWMNNDILKLGAGDQIKITIGDAGGGTSSFGSYLVAYGGSRGDGGAGGGTSSSSNGGIGYQFGGGGVYQEGGYGGNGGVWGGGGGGGNNKNGGHGGIYGGGGSGGLYYQYNSVDSSKVDIICKGGNGGKYGGGGCSFGNLSRSVVNNIISTNLFYGHGGIYGGDGSIIANVSGNGVLISQSENGTNTIGLEICGGEYNENFEGAGKFGNYGGGGGYGGNGGNTQGGGGGYGSNGGKGVYWISFTKLPGAGGGGYGGDGGNGRLGGGGGGGYGKNAKGGNGGYTNALWGGCIYSGGGGGGYYAAAYNVPAGNNYAATGGAGTVFNGVKYAYGGNSNEPGLGGVCIVQFYRWL